MSALNQLAEALTAGTIEVIDLTHTLDPDFPVIILPPEFGQCARFRMPVDDAPLKRSLRRELGSWIPSTNAAVRFERFVEFAEAELRLARQ